MPVEIRHTEKTILFALLKAKDLQGFKEAIAQLKATMEPEDVKLVEQRIAELEAQ